MAPREPARQRLAQVASVAMTKCILDLRVLVLDCRCGPFGPERCRFGCSRPGATARLQAASDRSESSNRGAADFPSAGRRCTVAPAAGVAAGAVRGP